jgi:hypothetical protein
VFGFGLINAPAAVTKTREMSQLYAQQVREEQMKAAADKAAADKAAADKAAADKLQKRQRLIKLPLTRLLLIN